MGKSSTEHDVRNVCENKLTPQTFAATEVITSDLKGKNRKITDPLIGFILIGVWVAFAYFSVKMFREENIDQVLYGTDYKGRLCGKDLGSDGEVLPKNWYPVDVAGSGRCINACPSKTDYTALICKEEEDLLELPGCLTNGTGNISTDQDVLVLCGGCMYQLLSLDTPIIHYCIPERISEAESYVNSFATELGLESESLYIGQAFDFLLRFANEVLVNWRIILGIGAGGSSLLGFLFLLMLRIPWFLGFGIWLGTILVPVTFGVGGYYCKFLSDNWEGKEDAKSLLQATTYICWILMSLFSLLIIYLRRRIQMSIGISKAGARAVLDFPSSTMYPFFSLIGFSILLFFFFAFLLFLASTGEAKENISELYGFEISYFAVKYSEETIYKFWFALVVFFWTSEFIIALGQVTLAFIFSKWYFCENKCEFADNLTLGSAVRISAMKHFGTAAFGSMFASMVQLLRFVLLRIQKQLNRIGAGNIVSNSAFYCCQCCTFVLERWLKFLSKNAFIKTAIFGYSYCRASREAYYLIQRHSYLMEVYGIVSGVSLFFGKIFVVLGCSLVSFAFMQQGFTADNIYSALIISTATGVLAYFVIDMFADVLDMAMCTTLLCFIADKEINENRSSPFVPSELDSFIKSVEKINT